LEKGWTACPISQVVAEAAANPLVAEPGTKIQYSNVGFAIAAAIIEKISGQRYEEFLEKRIFAPLEMGDTTFNPTDEQLSRQISMYTISKNSAPTYTPENKRMPLPHNGPTVYAYPAMGLWSTANDLLKFYQMLMLKGMGINGVRLLREQTVRNLLATSQRPLSLNPSQGYSLGFQILQDEPGWLAHGGAWGTYFKVNIDKQELCLWIVQLCGSPRPWDSGREEAAKSFFNNVP
jgi:CubicO group peptidase (beta-lactamase class C family)